MSARSPRLCSMPMSVVWSIGMSSPKICCSAPVLTSCSATSVWPVPHSPLVLIEERKRPATRSLSIQLLGAFELLWDGVPITTVDWPRLQSLLAYLVLHATAPQSRTHLAFLLWPDSSEAQAHT